MHYAQRDFEIISRNILGDLAIHGTDCRDNGFCVGGSARGEFNVEPTSVRRVASDSGVATLHETFNEFAGTLTSHLEVATHFS